MNGRTVFSLIFLVSILGSLGCSKEPKAFRLGYSPNLTHAPALVGAFRGDFSQSVGKDNFGAKVFHAGPSIIEALFAEEIDVAYVGPVPALNAFLRSNGKFILLSGAAQGGAALVAAPGKKKELEGRPLSGRLLTPQFGNTQDLMARSFFGEGKSNIHPVSNPDHINVFLRKEAIGSWTVEPWVSRLIVEASAEILWDESEIWLAEGMDAYDTTVLVARKEFLENNPDLIAGFLEAHQTISDWIKAEPDEATTVLNQALAQIQGKGLPEKIIQLALEKISFSMRYERAGFYFHYENMKNQNWLKDPLKNVDLAPFFQFALSENVKP